MIEDAGCRMQDAGYRIQENQTDGQSRQKCSKELKYWL